MNATTKKIRASIIGVTGYTGMELLRLLLVHPHVEIRALTSRQHEDQAIGDVYPHVAHLDLRITNTPPCEVARDSDIVFLALPHKAAQEVVAELYGTVKIVDLSADYRLRDAHEYERYYTAHNHPDLLKKAVYGAPEIVGREVIAKAGLVANPGCFALLSQLMLLPFKGQIARADIMAVTGSSGSGKTPGDGTHHPIRDHNMRSYSINAHRHMAEIVQNIGLAEETLNFVPTSGPFVRGIFASAFVTLSDKNPSLHGENMREMHSDAPFVRVSDNVALANVVGSNFCDLSYHLGRDGRVVVQGVLDNLVKGASGAAVQNMNLMFGFEETQGLLDLAPVYP
jgi:N-acetyl-gamma-glutamyl-phosphate reductase common form